MRELRRCPFTGRWILLSTERLHRPMHLRPETRPDDVAADCPFCPGAEARTPGELYRDGEPWRVRVVPNKHPAVGIEGSLEPSAVGLYDRMRGVGAHEVIIEGRSHDAAPWTEDASLLAASLRAARTRMRDLRQDRRFQSLVLFRNHGVEAGATLTHAHSQIIALPVRTPALASNLEAHVRHHALRGRCLSCDVIDQEQASRERMVARRPSCVALMPYAPRTPFETWILPRKHGPAFEALDDGGIQDLADLLRDVLLRLASALSDPPFNAVLHTLPEEPAFHWRLEILPKLTATAGFELGTDCFIHGTPPEAAAAWLRDQD